ncbi:MAG TPA: hypothetical protein VL202_12000 [Pararhizobium sp.]|uniref:hypothetical protein n=1 Tax=Pararhizobium sp. TaxID=1977563 RepID=UPI002B8BAF6F|nr:hypothetical protein [Pararhizobium sp.]HTO31886.1 hypothetical protein [Pararhizobium sp.]
MARNTRVAGELPWKAYLPTMRRIHIDYATARALNVRQGGSDTTIASKEPEATVRRFVAILNHRLHLFLSRNSNKGGADSILERSQTRKIARPRVSDSGAPRPLERPSAFDGIDCLASDKAIKDMMVVDKTDVMSRPVKTRLGKLAHVSKSRFDVVFDDCAIECYQMRSSRKKLYVFFSGAGRKGKTATKFDRLTWSRIFDGICLYIEDPMYKNFPEVDVGWYYGTRTVCYLDHIVELVSEFARVNAVDSEDIYLIGSSCAGYAAIYAADKIAGSTSISFNPQIVPAAWDKNRRFFNATGIDLEGDDRFGRNDIAESFDNAASRFVIVSNVRSQRDYAAQIRPVFAARGIEPHYGLNVINNAYIILADMLHPFDHGAFPGPMETKVLLSLLNDGVGNDALVPYAEMLKSSFETATRLSYMTLWSEFLTSDFPDFITVPASCDKKSCRLPVKGLPVTCYYQAYIDFTKEKCVVSFYVSDKKILKNDKYIKLMQDLAEASGGVMKSNKDSLFVHSANVSHADLDLAMARFIAKTSNRIFRHFGV